MYNVLGQYKRTIAEQNQRFFCVENENKVGSMTKYEEKRLHSQTTKFEYAGIPILENHREQEHQYLMDNPSAANNQYNIYILITDHIFVHLSPSPCNSFSSGFVKM